jgi:hypothetical protein
VVTQIPDASSCAATNSSQGRGATSTGRGPSVHRGRGGGRPPMVGSQDEEFKVTVQEEGSSGSSAGGEGECHSVGVCAGDAVEYRTES